MTKRAKTLEEVVATSPHVKLEKADPNAPTRIQLIPRLPKKDPPKK